MTTHGPRAEPSRTAPADAPQLSVIIPAYNEEGNVEQLYEALVHALEEFSRSFEIIVVDDGSTDTTAERVDRLCEKDERVQVISLRRNFGKAAALAAGFAAARGEMIVTMDADLQDDPSEIPRLVGELERGWDLVSGWKYPRHDPFTKTVPSRVINWLTRLITGTKLHDLNCGFKAYRREVVTHLKLYGELHRYIPVLAAWEGYRVTEIKVRHHPRRSGRSKYGFERFVRGFLDLLTVVFLTQYETRPSHLLGGLGLLLFAIGVAMNGYLTVLWLLGYGIGHRPLLFLAIMLVIVGVQFTCFGLVAEMVLHLTARQGREALPPASMIRRRSGPAADGRREQVAP